jgi:hypothetical protein
LAVVAMDMASWTSSLCQREWTYPQPLKSVGVDQILTDPVLAQIRVFEMMAAFVRMIPKVFKAVYLKMQLSSNKASLLKSRQIRELLVRLAMNSVSKVEEEESLTIGICPRKR